MNNNQNPYDQAPQTGQPMMPSPPIFPNGAWQRREENKWCFSGMIDAEEIVQYIDQMQDDLSSITKR